MNVLIVDDHPVVLEKLRAMVRAAFANTTVQTATDLEDALAAAGRGPRFDLAILDLGLPRCAGVEAVARFKAASPVSRVLVVSADDRPETMLAAFRAGANGYVSKSLPVKDMIAGLRLVANGGTYIPLELHGQDATAAKPPAAGPVPGRSEVVATNRQTEVLRLICDGFSNAAISQELGITEGTVKQHVHHLLRSLGATSRTEAIVIAMRTGLLEEKVSQRPLRRRKG